MRRLLLDTHVLLWWLADNPALGRKARKLIADPRNEVFISAVTSWEIAIKKTAGKLEAPDDIDTIVEDEGFSKLPISLYHGEVAGKLPLHHKDPFDRMLIAQSITIPLVLMTNDDSIRQYDVQTLDPAR
jgi:PIN domain nuclease of toxin-antitoxin system